MADNSSIPVASGNETFANKDIGGVKFPKHIQYDSSGSEVVPATQTTLAAVLAKLSSDPATQTTLAAILAKLTSDPATATGQASIVTAIENISPGGGSGGDASAANQETMISSLGDILAKITDDPSTETTLAAILAKIIAAPATEAKQDTANTSLSTIAGAVSSSKVATKAASGDFADGAIATLGAKTDAKSAATDTTAVSHTSILKQQSEYLKALGEVQTTPTANTLLDRLKTVGTQVTALNTVLGVKTDAKSTATDATSATAVQVIKQISASVQGATPAGTNHIGKVQVGDGTNNAVVKAASTSPALTDPALVVTIRPDSLKDTFGEYETVAASQTDQVLGATGASGDYLAGVLIIPGTAGCGAVSIKDGSGSAISIFAGGGTTALPTLAPIFVPLGIYSTGGAWKLTTGANVTAIGIGDFT